jgi:hypothetical protein
MSWEIGKGLKFAGYYGFTAYDEQVALVNAGGLTESPTTATFSLTDALWGATPDGLYKRLASNAANMGSRAAGSSFYSAQFCTLQFHPFSALGLDLQGDSGATVGGGLEALNISMAGFGAVDLAAANASGAADAAQIVGAHLPWAVSPTSLIPWGYLMRPSAHTFPGADSGNDANRALWSPAEIGVVSWTMTVFSTSVDLLGTFAAQGYYYDV